MIWSIVWWATWGWMLFILRICRALFGCNTRARNLWRIATWKYEPMRPYVAHRIEAYRVMGQPEEAMRLYEKDAKSRQAPWGRV